MVGTGCGRLRPQRREPQDWPHCFACQDPFIQHALAWNDGRLTDLGALPGNNSSDISELNGHGVGVGISENGRTDPHTGLAAAVAVMFKNGKVISLGTLPGGASSAAADINGQGQVAGISSNGTPTRSRACCSPTSSAPRSAGSSGETG